MYMRAGHQYGKNTIDKLRFMYIVLTLVATKSGQLNVSNTDLPDNRLLKTIVTWFVGSVGSILDSLMHNLLFPSEIRFTQSGLRLYFFQ